MKTFTKIAAALAVGSALFAGTAAASGWWNNRDHYRHWGGGPWYGGYPGWGGWGYPGWGGWGYPGWGGWGHPGWGRSRVQVITIPQKQPAPPQQPPIR